MSQRESVALAGVEHNAWPILALLLLLLGSLGLNVWLGWRVKAMQRSLTDLPVFRLSVGSSVPPIEAPQVNGTSHEISWRGAHPTVLYVFTPSCSWCERNLANITKLAASSMSSYRFVGLSLAEATLPQYLVARKLPFVVYAGVSSDTVHSLGLGATPQTLVVSENGQVLKNWVGAYGDQAQAEIERYFGVKLPGLQLAE